MIVDFKFSMTCEWLVLIGEDKDKSLWSPKVFSTEILSYQFAKDFSHYHFALYGSILQYTIKSKGTRNKIKSWI